MGKWTDLKKRYQPYRDGDASFVAKVAEVRSAQVARPFQELITYFVETRQRKNALEEQIKDLNVKLEAVGQLLLEHFEEQDLTSVKTTAGQTLYVSVEPYSSVVDRGVLETHLDQHPEFEHLYHVNWQGLNALVKELLEQGRDAEIPPGVGIFLKMQVRVRKGA